MFQKYKQLHYAHIYLQKNDVVRFPKYNYILIDSNFEAKGMVEVPDAVWEIAYIEAIIKEYSERKLNIAANLAIALYASQMPYPHQQKINAKYIIDTNRMYNSNYCKYEKNIEKYLSLM